MKKPERFNKALSKLIKAFFNDDLKKESCSHCAVGNICNNDDAWSVVFLCIPDEGQNIYLEYYKGYPKSVIDKTGYSLYQLAKVEKAFEFNTKIPFNRYRFHTKDEIMKDQFNGLMAVVDVLCKIERLDSEEYKKAFEYNENFEPVNK